MSATRSSPSGRTAGRWAGRPRRGKHTEEGHELGILGGLAALSLDALSSVAYGPQVMISVLAAALLVPVGAETNSLIPMFTIGVFVGFTLSQVGLVVHWRRGARRAGGFVRR